MSNSMHLNRRRLLDEARSLGIVGRHRMNNSKLKAAITARYLEAPGPLLPTSPVIAGTVVSDNSAMMAQLRKDIEDVNVDRWEYGTVIRWEAKYDGEFRDAFLYAAVKTPSGWVSTARIETGSVPKTMGYDKLVKILARRTTHNVQVATTWENVG
jgi:hypothetical protein